MQTVPGAGDRANVQGAERGRRTREPRGGAESSRSPDRAGRECGREQTPGSQERGDGRKNRGRVKAQGRGEGKGANDGLEVKEAGQGGEDAQEAPDVGVLGMDDEGFRSETIPAEDRRCRQAPPWSKAGAGEGIQKEDGGGVSGEGEEVEPGEGGGKVQVKREAQ